MKLTLHVHYTDDYPDVLPDLSLTAVEGEIEDEELETLLEELKTVVRLLYIRNILQLFQMARRGAKILEWP